MCNISNAHIGWVCTGGTAAAVYSGCGTPSRAPARARPQQARAPGGNISAHLQCYHVGDLHI